MLRSQVKETVSRIVSRHVFAIGGTFRCMEHITCHCGNPGEDRGNGLEDICDPCLNAWLAAGEPELCPCPKFDAIAPDIVATRGKVEAITYG